MEIVKREFIYREKTGLEPAEFKAYINKYIKELRARDDVSKVSGTVTEDFSKCTVKYTQVLPDPKPVDIVSDEDDEFETEETPISEEVQNQLG